jgi:hypothetical protein
MGILSATGRTHRDELADLLYVLSLTLSSWHPAEVLHSILR